MKDLLWAADGAWPVLEEGEDRLTKTASIHPPPPIHTHDSTAKHKFPVVELQGGRWGESGICSWVTASRSEPQGETEFTLNGK